MKTNRIGHTQSAFTLIELLVVIAIISILAAILFPVFATVRESARQSSTMTNMHTVYLGARLYYEDEGHYPSSLFGYAEGPTNFPPGPSSPSAYVLTSGSATNATPMDQATENFATAGGNGVLNKGYLYREQVKDFNTFVNSINPVAKQQNGKTQVTSVIYPTTLPALVSGGTPSGTVKWNDTAPSGTCPKSPDADSPTFSGSSYNGIPKIYYKMDSMDIGPALTTDTNGNVVPVMNGNNFVYELHYSPDWTKERFDPTNNCDEQVIGGVNKAIVAQLKYKNPPTERTVLTYITDHVAYNNNNKVLILLMSGTARTMDAKQAITSTSGHVLPLGY